MRLNTRTWGSGSRLAVLVHGMLADSGTWWEVGPALASRGYFVVAPDLPGHGHSPADGAADMSVFASSLLSSVPAAPSLVLAHSMGSFVVSAVLGEMRPERAVYVDTPVGASHSMPREVIAAGYAKGKARLTLENLRAKEPSWQEQDRIAEADAAKLFDVETAASLLSSAAGVDYTPTASVPSLMVRANPSRFVPDSVVLSLEERGFAVRSIEGASHTAWYGKHEKFMAVLDEWLES